MDEHDAHILVPCSTVRSKVILLRDEVGDDQSNMTAGDVQVLLQRELAPLNVWRSCAVEFYRHGYRDEFLEILKEIVSSMQEQDVANSYRAAQSDSFENDMIEIYNSLAAYSNDELARLQATFGSSGAKQNELKEDTMRALRSAEDLGAFAGNDYINIIKGFYALRTGLLSTLPLPFSFAGPNPIL